MFYRIVYFLIRITESLFKLLPMSANLWLARRSGDMMYLFMPKRRRVALENLDRAFGLSKSWPEKRRIARQSFQSAAMAIVELFCVEKIKKTAKEHFKIYGLENIEEALKRGKGVISAIAHLGSWEYLSFFSHLTGIPYSFVVKAIRNPHIDKAIHRLRQVMEVNPVFKDDSMKPILRELHANHGVAILVDQWAGPDGIWLEFFGDPTSTTSIPIRLSKKSKAPICLSYCLRRPGENYEIHILPPFGIDENDLNWEMNATKKINRMLEKEILKHPEQWLWFHRRWKPKPSQLRELNAHPAKSR